MAHVRDWRIDVMRAHSRLFDIMPDEQERSFGYSLCEAGWRGLMERLCTRIEGALAENETFEFVRIKQKVGIIRVDWDGEVSDETAMRIHGAVSLATARSASTCEICGAEGRLYSNRSWLATVCAEHAKGAPVQVRPGFENISVLRRRPGAPDMTTSMSHLGMRSLRCGIVPPSACRSLGGASTSVCASAPHWCECTAAIAEARAFGIRFDLLRTPCHRWE